MLGEIGGDAAGEGVAVGSSRAGVRGSTQAGDVASRVESLAAVQFRGVSDAVQEAVVQSGECPRETAERRDACARGYEERGACGGALVGGKGAGAESALVEGKGAEGSIDPQCVAGTAAPERAGHSALGYLPDEDFEKRIPGRGIHRVLSRISASGQAEAHPLAGAESQALPRESEDEGARGKVADLENAMRAPRLRGRG